MFERLDAVTEKYEELTKKLTDPEVLGDYNTLKKLSKEHKDLEETHLKYKEYKKKNLKNRSSNIRDTLDRSKIKNGCFSEHSSIISFSVFPLFSLPFSSFLQQTTLPHRSKSELPKRW